MSATARPGRGRQPALGVEERSVDHAASVSLRDTLVAVATKRPFIRERALKDRRLILGAAVGVVGELGAKLPLHAEKRWRAKRPIDRPGPCSVLPAPGCPYSCSGVNPFRLMQANRRGVVLRRVRLPAGQLVGLAEVIGLDQIF